MGKEREREKERKERNWDSSLQCCVVSGFAGVGFTKFCIFFEKKQTILFFLPIKKAFLSIHCGDLVNFGPYFALPFPFLPPQPPAVPLHREKEKRRRRSRRGRDIRHRN